MKIEMTALEKTTSRENGRPYFEHLSKQIKMSSAMKFPHGPLEYVKSFTLHIV